MKKEIPSPEVFERLINCCDDGGVFFHGDGNISFILSDDLKIENFCRDLSVRRSKMRWLEVKQRLATERYFCCFILKPFSFYRLRQSDFHILIIQAMTLLRSLFTSETPLTNTFFPFQSSSHPLSIAFKPSISPCDSVLRQV